METENNNMEPNPELGPDAMLNTVLESDATTDNIKPYSPEIDVPPGHVVLDGLVMPRACAKVWSQFQKHHNSSKNGDSNSNSSHSTNGNGNGHGKDFKYVGIDKFNGKAKENVNNWLEHAAAKLRASRVPKDLWVQEAGKRLFEAAGNWFATWVNNRSDEQIDNWTDFKTDLANNFRVTESLQDIAIQLMDLPHKTSLSQYATDFEEIRRKILNPAQADNIHIRAAFLNRLKPSVVALIRPELNTSMPALIAEALHAEKRANIEYHARTTQRGHRDNNDKRKPPIGQHPREDRNKRFNKNRNKDKDKVEIHNADIDIHYSSDPGLSDLEGLLIPEQGKAMGEQA